MEYIRPMRLPVLQFLMLGLLLQGTAGAMGFLHEEGMVEAMRYAARYSGRISFLAYLLSMLVFTRCIAGRVDRDTAVHTALLFACQLATVVALGGWLAVGNWFWRCTGGSILPRHRRDFCFFLPPDSSLHSISNVVILSFLSTSYVFQSEFYQILACSEATIEFFFTGALKTFMTATFFPIGRVPLMASM